MKVVLDLSQRTRQILVTHLPGEQLQRRGERHAGVDERGELTREQDDVPRSRPEQSRKVPDQVDPPPDSRGCALLPSINIPLRDPNLPVLLRCWYG